MRLSIIKRGDGIGRLIMALHRDEDLEHWFCLYTDGNIYRLHYLEFDFYEVRGLPRHITDTCLAERIDSLERLYAEEVQNGKTCLFLAIHYEKLPASTMAYNNKEKNPERWEKVVERVSYYDRKSEGHYMNAQSYGVQLSELRDLKALAALTEQYLDDNRRHKLQNPIFIPATGQQLSFF